MRRLVVEFLKGAREEIIVWMMRFFRICMEVGRYSKDLKNACTVSVYNDKGDKNDCRNYGGIIN